MAKGLIAIVGATATGKSGLAIALAERFVGIVIGADSRQVYRELDIGTAKPTLAERGEVPHYLIDICEPTETLTLASYQRQARAIIERCQATPDGAVPFVVGGTGLYVRAIVRGLKIPPVPPQAELRAQLTNLGQGQCYAQLQQVDAMAAAKIHPHDRVRTLRALEVFYVTGQPISAQQGEDPPNYPILPIGLAAEPSAIAHRIQQRTEAMVVAGFGAEVETLAAKYGWELPLLDTLGYREMGEYLRGQIDLAEAKALTVRHTCQFAKRQRTWFGADPSIEWFDCDRPDLVLAVGERVRAFLDALG